MSSSNLACAPFVVVFSFVSQLEQTGETRVLMKGETSVGKRARSLVSFGDIAECLAKVSFRLRLSACGLVGTLDSITCQTVHNYYVTVHSFFCERVFVFWSLNECACVSWLAMLSIVADSRLC